jgi:hypothetical protein
MKKLIYFLLAAVVISSCKKAPATIAANGCISQVPVTRLSAADSATVAGLMKNNNLPTAGLAFNAYQFYTTGTGTQQTLVQIATASQIRNNLPLFLYDVTYGFNNGLTDNDIPALAGNISLDTKATLPLQTLRDSFLYVDKGMEYNPSVALGLKDSCLVAVFGYYDLNVDFPQKGTDFIKAWYVHPKNSEWPQGYFRDDTGAALLFKPLSSSGEVP